MHERYASLLVSYCTDVQPGENVMISVDAVVANAATADAVPNAVAPIMRSFRRPILSPSVPIVISELAIKNP